MRTVRLSVTFNDRLNELLDRGEIEFGRELVEEKRRLVYAAIRQYIAVFPGSRRRDETLALHIYPVANTPFLLAYDFDETEVRIHYILPAKSDRIPVDPADIIW
jgi:hypothetical protein